MREIRMKSISAGPDGIFHAETNYVVGLDLTEEKAKQFVDGEHAVYVSSKGFTPVQEKAVSAPAETRDKGKTSLDQEKPAVEPPASPDKPVMQAASPVAPAFGKGSDK